MKDYVINSKLINEWHWEKNNNLGIYPDKITLGSEKGAWWVCKNGHEWFTRVVNRGRGNNCPYCSNQRVLVGYNDLETTYPDLVKEWNDDKNGDLLPNMITAGSNKKVWWICKYGHEWNAVIHTRTTGGCGCPQCAKEFKTSEQEMRVYYYIHKYFPDAISGFTDKQSGIYELDIYIPNLQVGVEYDGAKWHQDINRDLRKDIVCEKNNIKLLRIRESDCPKYESSCTFINLENKSESVLSEAIINILLLLDVEAPDVNFNRDIADIECLRHHKIQNNSLAMLYPDIAVEWHPTKNGNLTPENVTYSSDKKVWWQCLKCNNEWVTMVSTRTRADGCGCPSCGRERTRKSKCKSVYCLELQQAFESAKYASNQTGVSHHGILNCAKGKQQFAGKHPITGERLHWVFTNSTVQN